MPREIREASYGAGATQWDTIRTNVLPYHEHLSKRAALERIELATAGLDALSARYLKEEIKSLRDMGIKDRVTAGRRKVVVTVGFAILALAYFGLRHLNRNIYYGFLALCGLFMIVFGFYLGSAPFLKPLA